MRHNLYTLAVILLILSCNINSKKHIDSVIEQPELQIDTSDAKYKSKEKFIGRWKELSRYDNADIPSYSSITHNSNRFLIFTKDSFFYIEKSDTLFRDYYVICINSIEDGKTSYRIIGNYKDESRDRNILNKPYFRIATFDNNVLSIDAGTTHSVGFIFEREY
jgi:hypothetical protein